MLQLCYTSLCWRETNVSTPEGYFVNSHAKIYVVSIKYVHSNVLINAGMLQLYYNN